MKAWIWIRTILLNAVTVAILVMLIHDACYNSINYDTYLWSMSVDWRSLNSLGQIVALVISCIESNKICEWYDWYKKQKGQEQNKNKEDN